MSGKPWADEETRALKALIQSGIGGAEACRALRAQGFNRTPDSVSTKLKVERIMAPSEWHPQISLSQAERFTKPLVVEGDAIVLPDIHCPFHDAIWMNRVIGLALRWDVKQAIIAGDLADFQAFGHWMKEGALTANQELESLETILDEIVANFDKTIYFAGNHDVRPIKALGDVGLNVKWIMKMFTPSKNCLISDYHWCDLKSNGERFRIEHPKNTSVHGTRVPKALASVYLCHQIHAHGHVWGMTRDVSNHYWAIDSGVCCDEARIDYVSKIHGNRPRLIRGAVIVKDGIPYLLGEHNIAGYERMTLRT